MKRKIKVNFSDFWAGFDKYNNFFYQLLSQIYDIEIDPEPDYLFFSTFGKEYLKYDCIRIFFTGENVRPDFNLCDYAVGFDRMSFGDRYMRYPLFLLYQEDWNRALHKHEIKKGEFLQNKKKFCNFIYSNANTTTKRDQFFELLSQYKHVDSGGKYRNNIGGPVKDKVTWQSEYKFTIAFENSVTPGYMTEKLIHAYAACTIPIYMGDPKLLEEFNPKSLIVCESKNDFERVIEQVKRIDQDDALYLRMLQEPMLKDQAAYCAQYSEQKLSKFFQSVIEQPKEHAFRRDRYSWTMNVENEQRFLRIVEKCKPIELFICKNPLERWKREKRK